MRRLLFLPLALAMLLSVLPAPASAQVCQGGVNLICSTTTDLSVVPVEAPIKPLAGFVVLPLQVIYSYTPVPLSMSSTQIDLAISDLPPWATATISPSTVYIPVSLVELSGGSTVTKHASASILVSMTADAPAFTTGTMEIIATARPNGNLQPSMGKAQVPLQADFFGQTVATPAASDVVVKSVGATPVAVTLANFGNGIVRVESAVLEAPKGIKVTPPAPVTLGARDMGVERTSKTVSFAVRPTSGWEEGNLVLVFHTVYALDEKLQGPDVRVPIHLSHASESAGDVAVESLMAGDVTQPIPLGLAFAGLALAGTLAWQRGRKL